MGVCVCVCVYVCANRCKHTPAHTRQDGGCCRLSIHVRRWGNEDKLLL